MDILAAAAADVAMNDSAASGVRVGVGALESGATVAAAMTYAVAAAAAAVPVVGVPAIGSPVAVAAAVACAAAAAVKMAVAAAESEVERVELVADAVDTLLMYEGFSRGGASWGCVDDTASS